jgi:hypothetical protein
MSELAALEARLQAEDSDCSMSSAGTVEAMKGAADQGGPPVVGSLHPGPSLESSPTGMVPVPAVVASPPPVRPEPVMPTPEMCCGNGCQNCVYLVYWSEMADLERERAAGEGVFTGIDH